MKMTSETGPFLRAPVISDSILPANSPRHSNTIRLIFTLSAGIGSLPPHPVYASNMFDSLSMVLRTISGTVPCSGSIVTTSSSWSRISPRRSVKPSSILQLPGCSVRHVTHPTHLRMRMSRRQTSPPKPSLSAITKRSASMIRERLSCQINPRSISRSRRGSH